MECMVHVLSVCVCACHDSVKSTPAPPGCFVANQWSMLPRPPPTAMSDGGPLREKGWNMPSLATHSTQPLSTPVAMVETSCW